MTYEVAKDFSPAPVGWNVATITTNPRNVRGYLLAWDPVNQREVWRANYLGPWNGGVLTTAGGLVIQGNAAGDFSAYRADNGEKLWSMFAQSSVMAAPVSYEVNGEQYIAVLSGWGGAYSFLQGKDADKSGNIRNISRLLVFKLGATKKLPPLLPEPTLALNPPPEPSPASVAAGEALFGRYCSVCHGEAAVGGGVVPDLRTSPFNSVDAWYSIVLDGALKEGGMAAFAQVLDRSQAGAIRDYVVHRAREDEAALGIRKHQPDPNHGAMIVAQGAAGSGNACAQCHAFTGSSDGSGAFPRLSGQPAAYLARQLRDFASGARANAVMSPIASSLSADDIEDVAAYFASVETPFPLLPRMDEALVKKGEVIAESGIPTKGIPGCGSCHGARGVGEAPTIPYLAGQYAHYMALELQMWQRGFRRNSPEAMGMFSKKLDQDEIAAVAAYYQQLRSGPVVVQTRQ